MKIISGMAAVALLALSATGPAAAAGCNGVVNPLVWGCAAWDNNNGPQYPNYRAPARSNAAPQVTRGNASGIISNNATQGITTQRGAGIVSGGAGNIVAGGAGN
jgi:hypothetical protein